ncbi:MAG: 23S rRNA (uracil(1939)-C(5))-methyltransferase RlmD [Acidiferrobacterales bacterium]
MAIARIESLDYEGNGVARLDGKAVFIQGALPGDEVRFRYHNKKRNFDTGGVTEILVPSPDRVVPRCPHFGVCGGCSLQHLRPEAQLREKQQVLRDSLAHIGKVQPDAWFPPLHGPVWGYRRKARLGVRFVPKKGGVLVGFREKRHSFITPLGSCEVLDPAVSALLPPLHTLIAGLSRPERMPQIEVAVGDPMDNVLCVALVFRHLEPLAADDLNQLRRFGECHAVQIFLQPAGPDSISRLWPAESADLVYRLPEQAIELRFEPKDFVQVNATINRALVSRALEILEPGVNEAVLDLFCGLGNFSLPLARRARRVLGVEGDNALVGRARSNAVHNGIGNTEFLAADLYAADGPAPWGSEHFDRWLLDPPRTGAMEVLKRLPPDGSGPRRIVYVSCNPGTLARDSEVLVHVKGYRLAGAGVLDMFPHTTHVESLALFESTA